MAIPDRQPPDLEDDEVGRDFVKMLRDTHDDHLPHSLSFVLDVPTETGATALGRALSASLGEAVGELEVTHRDDAARHWAVKAHLAPRILTEAFVTSLHRQLRHSAAVYDGNLAKFSLHRHRSDSLPGGSRDR